MAASFKRQRRPAGARRPAWGALLSTLLALLLSPLPATAAPITHVLLKYHAPTEAMVERLCLLPRSGDPASSGYEVSASFNPPRWPVPSMISVARSPHEWCNGSDGGGGGSRPRSALAAPSSPLDDRRAGAADTFATGPPPPPVFWLDEAAMRRVLGDTLGEHIHKHLYLLGSTAELGALLLCVVSLEPVEKGKLTPPRYPQCGTQCTATPSATIISTFSSRMARCVAFRDNSGSSVPLSSVPLFDPPYPTRPPQWRGRGTCWLGCERSTRTTAVTTCAMALRGPTTCCRPTPTPATLSFRCGCLTAGPTRLSIR